jgi:hypothetical protein
MKHDVRMATRGLMLNDSRQLLTLLLVAFLFVGCSHGIERGGFDACAAGSPCTLEGMLQLFPGEPAGAAVLSDGDRCAKLALPDAFFVDPLRKQWHSKAVVAEGRAFAQPNYQTELGVLSWYAEKDRKLATGMCDHGPGIYVDTLRSASRETWPGKR